MLVGTRSWRIGKCNRASERPGTGKQAVRVALQSAVPIYGNGISAMTAHLARRMMERMASEPQGPREPEAKERSWRVKPMAEGEP